VLRKTELGQGIPVSNPGGIVFPDWGKAPLADMSVLDSALMFADRISTSPIMGGSTQARNAPRTARGTLALLSEGNLRVDILVSIIQREGLPEVMRQIAGLYSAYLPDEKHFYVTGRDKIRRPEIMARKMIRGQFEFTFKGNSTNTNPEIQRTLAQIRYQVAMTNPLYANDPIKMRELLRDLLMALSDPTADVERILPNLPGMGAEPHAPMTQKDELTMMRMRQPVAVLATDNDLQHLQEIDKLKNSPAIEQWDDVAIALLAQHEIAHLQQQQRKVQQAQVAAANAGGGGEQNLSPGRVSEGSLGDLEGAVQ
jgi:hypothetical protein